MSSNPHTPADVAAAVERLAPAAWAEEWDNVGWLVRRDIVPDGPLRVILSLDPVDPEWARGAGFHVNVAHHPTPFRPLRGLDESTWAARAWAAGLNFIAAHTNLDVAPGGVNDALVEALGLEDARPMVPSPQARLVKFVTFVPPDHLESVRMACAAAGAGAIGNYNECSFASPGAGTFRPLPGSDPFTQTPVGDLERAEEARLEMIAPAHLQEAIVAAAKAAHPYEEMAFDVIPLSNLDPRVGMGRIGALPEPMPLDDFAAHVSRRLGTARISVSGPAKDVHTVAVMGGSGGKYFNGARAAHAYVTGEVGHHDAMDAAALGLCLIDAGHFATERPVLARLKSALGSALPNAEFSIADESDPLRRAAV
ncbi:MAG TPA: Nif3-like dinuclear metal center hexameric protein [Armatimonadota bacterium]|jgi:dinuclear metal center YbgI/SA1388 family protein